ncbi:MAG: lysophospholipid acyltransferase family protein [Bacteroidota bacterium]
MLRRHFEGIYVAGSENVQNLDRSRPIILYGNHSCWWDGLLEFYFSHDLYRFDAYLMMEEKQLVRYSFFRWIGAFSVRRESPREAVAALRYAAALFDRPNRVLWIYPQGVMKPNDVRPLGFYTGAARLTQMVDGAQLVPVAHRYEFLMEQRPAAITAFGTPTLEQGMGDPRELTTKLEDRLVDLLDTLRCSIVSGGLTRFSRVLGGESSTNVAYDKARMKDMQ